MGSEYIAGIDVGSTAVKVGVFDSKGSLVQYKSIIYPTHRVSETIVEQDPNAWVKNIISSLKEFKYNGIEELSGLSLCSQVNTHVFVDQFGRSLIPAIFWQDGRASHEAKELDSVVSDEQKISWWGAPMPIDSSHVLARMLWVKRNQPRIWERTKYVMLPKDYCILQLTGELVTDPLSNIGLIGSDRNYIEDVFNLVPGAAERVADLKEINEVVGVLRKEVPFGGTSVINGTMDAWMGLLGAGGCVENTSVYLSGTSEILGINSNTIIPTPGIIVFPKCENIRFHAGPTQSGGASKLWFCDLFELSPHAMGELAAKTVTNTKVPIFLPHLQGERAPIWESKLKGVFYGLTAKTSQSDLARAVYEGVAFSAKWLLNTLETSAGQVSDEINCGGGGFQSDSWNQIRANILDKRLKRLEVKDPGILGASALAAFGIGRYKSLKDSVESSIRFNKAYEPERSMTNYYSEIFEIYQEITNFNITISEKFANSGQ